MNALFSTWLLGLAACIFANLPFFSNRWLGIVPTPADRGKPIAGRLGEWLVGYGLFLLLGFWIEQRVGQRVPQGWQFYAIAACLFAVLAFPGFVWRLLFQGRSIR